MSANTLIAEKINASDALVDTGLAGANDFAEVSIDLITQTAPSVSFDPPDQAPLSYETVPASLPSEVDGTLQSDAISKLSSVDDAIEDLESLKAQLNARLSAFNEEINSIADRVESLSDIADNIYIPTESDFAFSELGYSDALDSALRQKLIDEIGVNGEGLSSDADAALYSRSSERLELSRQKKIDAALIKHCGRGFSMPQGFHVKEVDDINDAHRVERDAVAHEIMQAQAKLGVENKWMFLNAGISYNLQMIEYCNKQAERGLSATADVYDFTIQAIKLRLGIMEKQLEFAKDDALVLIRQKITLLEQYKPQLEISMQKISSLIESAKTYISSYRVNASVYLSSISAEAKASRLRQMENELTLEDQKEVVSIGAIAAKSNLKAFEAMQKIKLSGYKSIGNMHTENIRSSLEAINAVVQLFEKGETAIVE